MYQATDLKIFHFYFSCLRYFKTETIPDSFDSKITIVNEHQLNFMNSEIFFIKKAFVIMFKARCLQIGGYLANFETLEETMLMKDKLKKMKTGKFIYLDIIIRKL